MDPVLIGVAAVFGAGCGLFVPRVVYRMAVGPSEEWRQDCPDGHPLTRGAAGGWLGAARCVASCGRFGVTRVRAGLVSAAVCAIVAAAVGPRPELAVWLLMVPGCVVLAWVDGTVHRLPDVLTLPLAAAALVLLGVAAALPGHRGSWTTAALGAMALATVYLVLFVIHPSGLGLGDAKLALAVGAVLGWYGWGILIVGTFLAFLLGALYGSMLLLLGRATRTTHLPFGPAMLFGVLGGLVFGAGSLH